MKKLLCLLFGHKKTFGIVDVKVHYNMSQMAPEPNHGWAEVCMHCHEMLSEIEWEFE